MLKKNRKRENETEQATKIKKFEERKRNKKGIKETEEKMEKERNKSI